ncbi:hypothetical protein [Polymorphospora rubra]|uniref:Uncharacterized protein n=1 Tax=Polymorphospora rubra TaxID=338584 RepID=A0A810MVG9_9ACTN|nr:hypothetical protein [Polymorphospora rubra]BCJ63425.1 hypothetical protein Prubr_04460 [Polymorphospora rubra]
MVYVRLEQEWTDGQGTTHPAGSSVDVDAATLADLEARGIVAAGGGGWDGPGGGGGGDDKDWAGPTGWAGPTSTQP